MLGVNWLRAEQGSDFAPYALYAIPILKLKNFCQILIALLFFVEDHRLVFQ